MRRLIVLMMALAMMTVSGAVAPAIAGGDDGTVTEGDVMAHFRTSHHAGAQPNAWFDGGIRPFVGSPWDGSAQCVDDWHVLVIAEWLGEHFQTGTNKGDMDLLDTTWVELILDGETVTETVRSSYKPLFTDGLSGLRTTWYFETGAFFAPGELGIGSHTFMTIWHTPVGDFVDGPINFTVDASTGPACD